MSAGSVAPFRAALESRLHAVLDALGANTDELASVEELAAAVCDRVVTGSASDAWLAFVGFSAQFPVADELAAFRRELQLAAPADRVAVAVSTAGAAPGAVRAGARTLRIVSDVPLIDVGHSATTDHNTGIQRVVRRTLPHWESLAHELVVWNDDDRGYRPLRAVERDRILKWGSGAVAHPTGTEPDHDIIIVPFGTTVVLPEVATPSRCAPLACLAESSGCRVGLIGYDAIPLVSADLVDPQEAERFAHYLTVVKHADVVAGISAAAAAEFEGFKRALPAQGITGPEVVVVSLAEGLGASRGLREPLAEGSAPVVLCVGSHEPRKNQEAVLAAGAALHARGLRFRLVFVGGGSRANITRFDRELASLRSTGMQVESHRRLDDPALFSLYAQARFSVFVSLHEGYGLPVVESMSHGTPVLTSNYGSLAEIAAGGGCVQADPRSLADIEDGMAAMLTDDGLIDRLRNEIAQRPERPWSDYARDLWQSLVAPTAAAR